MMVSRNILIDVVGYFIAGHLKLLEIETWNLQMSSVDIRDFSIYL